MTKLILPYHVRTDTLAYFKSQPLFVAKSMRDLMVSDMVTAIKAYLPHCGEVTPESEAITFYAGNAIMAELTKRYGPDEPLPPEALKLAQWYLKTGSLAAQRLLYYLALIITRESRHVIGYSGVAEFGPVYTEFNKYIHKASGSMHAKTLFLAGAPVMKLGAYADAICGTFWKGHFSGGFGGAKWGEIADVFKSYVDGKLTPEMVTDVSWALCHNGGPIFNKGMTYECYETEHIMTVLDVQRSGQVPEMVAQMLSRVEGHIKLDAYTAVHNAKALFPDAFGSTVDWKKVKLAGAVQNYSQYEKAQTAKKSVAAGKVFYVTPETWVEVVDRKVAA